MLHAFIYNALPSLEELLYRNSIIVVARTLSEKPPAVSAGMNGKGGKGGFLFRVY